MKVIRNIVSWPFAVVTVLCGGVGVIFYGIAVGAAIMADKIAGGGKDD